jgi:uncharacterized protein (DUF302 family)
MPALADAVPGNGMVHLESPYSVPETIQRLEALLAARKIPVVARVDHAKAAAEVGLQMTPTVLLIFGNAKSGTPLMIESPTSAIDLPLKALIWEDGSGKIRVSYNTPEYLAHRHSVSPSLLQNIAGIRSILEEVVGKTSA